ncbi:MAG: efflux RND transporter periplasmic adaptor subunit [Aliarcobacter sp.]|jgi:RND family efflux transporter MFP subunit|nr:efflux RND transporter periplasmic adaptor subunit [Aliarcobacter sp.]
MIKILLTTTFFCLNLLANQIELSGTVISDNEKIITSRNMGYIKEVYVSEGSNVKKGDILYEIDSSNIDSNKKEILLNLEILQNQTKNIELNLGRYKRLQAQDLVSKYEVEQLELNLLNSKSMVNIANAKLKEINAQYDYLKIKAPNNGLIIKKSIKVGEMAMPSIPALILTDLSNLLIKTDISESNLNDIKIGQKVNIEITSQNFKTEGKIEAIIPNTNDLTHSFVLKISFDKKDFNIYPGMYSKVFLDLDIKN